MGRCPWDTGPYKLVGGLSPDKRSDRVVLEANTDYWDHSRFPRLQHIIFDNTLSQKDAVELVETGEGRVDVVTGLSPLDAAGGRKSLRQGGENAGELDDGGRASSTGGKREAHGTMSGCARR